MGDIPRLNFARASSIGILPDAIERSSARTPVPAASTTTTVQVADDSAAAAVQITALTPAPFLAAGQRAPLRALSAEPTAFGGSLHPGLFPVHALSMDLSRLASMPPRAHSAPLTARIDVGPTPSSEMVHTGTSNHPTPVLTMSNNATLY